MDPRVLQGLLVKWEDLDPWVLPACLVREDAPDPAVPLVNVDHLVTWESLVQWVRWVSVGHLDIQDLQE